MTVEEYVVKKLTIKPHGAPDHNNKPTEAGLGGGNCILCSSFGCQYDVSITGNVYGANYKFVVGTFTLCEKCVSKVKIEMVDEEIEEFCKIAHKKYPEIFKENFYHNPGFRQAFNLPPLKKSFKWPWRK